MSFVSINFLVFVFTILTLYYILPQPLKKYGILCGNILFYSMTGVQNLFLLGGMICLSFICGKVISKSKSKFFLMVGIIISLFPLLIYKYCDFGISILNTLFGKEILPYFEIIEPLGISFFTFKVISYLVDNFHNVLKEKYSFADYAIYVSFFPTIASGPIDRADPFLKQIRNPIGWNFDRFVRGFLIMLYGYFQKVVIADRLGYIVSSVFDNYEAYYGFALFITSLLYSIQIYLDFSGYTYIVAGVAYAMGVEITQNFRQPYYSSSIKEFWSRWHISLSSWLRDYIYIPLGGNRKGKIRKYVNLIIVFLVSGIWHGAGWNYIVWGLLHGIYQIVEDLFGKIKKVRLPHFLKVLFTFLMVNFAWIIFREKGQLSTALDIIMCMGDFGRISFEWIRNLDIPNTILLALLVGMLVVFFIDYLCYRNIDVIDKFLKLNIVLRWMIMYVLIFAIILLGYYGPTYDASQFIYFQF